MDLNSIPWKDTLTIGAAAVGAVLGVMNTWNSINQRRLRLRVRPSHILAPHHRGELFGIEVVNLSSFPVTIAEIGFALNGNRADRGRRIAIPRPILPDDKPWPRRLEPREAVSTLFEVSQIDPLQGVLGKAYANTACGEFRYGDSPARKQLREAIRLGGRPLR